PAGRGATRRASCRTPCGNLPEHIHELAEVQEVQWFNDEEKSVLRRCLERLPDKSRRLIELHHHQRHASFSIPDQHRKSARSNGFFQMRLTGPFGSNAVLE